MTLSVVFTDCVRTGATGAWVELIIGYIKHEKHPAH